MTAAPAAIIETAPPIYFWIGRGHKGEKVFIWCGQFVEEGTYYANMADYVRNGKKGKCPKGIY